MKPWELLGDTRTPDGTRLTLMKRDREYVIFADGKILMSSRMHGSEEALATLACGHLQAAEAPRVLVGGLGLGYTLRATLDTLPASAEVVVAELVSGVVDWNRGPLAPLAGHPLDDRRVRVVVEDVGVTLRRSPATFDAILLDVDNGASGLTTAANDRLYDAAGLERAKAAIRPGGCLAVWSAVDDPAFRERLRSRGFAVTTERVAAYAGGNSLNWLFVGRC